MKIGPMHAPFIAQKIAIDMQRSKLVKMTQGLESVAHAAQVIVEADIHKEHTLEEAVNKLIDENEEQIDYYLADEKQLFWMMKRKLAPEHGVILDHEERYSDLAHQVHMALYDEDLINYDVAENKIKNIIYNAIDDYFKQRGSIEEAVSEKISHYKRKLIPGSEEYEMVYAKLLEEELSARGLK